MKVLIVEDELLLAKQLKKMLALADPDAEVTGITQSVSETVCWLRNNGIPDLVLMDIELADGQSFEVFQEIKLNAPVIFTTAYDEYAIKAFKVNSVDYLLKPIRQEELEAALVKLRERNHPQQLITGIEALLQGINPDRQQQAFRERILIRLKQAMVSINTGSVAYFQSEQGCCFLYTKDNKKYLTDLTLDELEQSLNPQKFFRANRQFLVSDCCIHEIHTWFNQKLRVTLKPDCGEHIVISREKSGAFKSWLGA